MNNHKTRLFFFFLIASIIFYSCSNSQKRKAVDFDILNASLKIESDKLTKQNDSINRLFKEKLLNEKAFQISELWFLKANCPKLQSDETYKFIDQTISALNTNSINSDSLYFQLTFLKEKILRIDPEISKFIEVKSEIITHNLDSLKQLNKETFQSYFNDKSKDEQLFFLRQVILNIKTVENEILIFCYNKTK